MTDPTLRSALTFAFAFTWSGPSFSLACTWPSMLAEAEASNDG